MYVARDGRSRSRDAGTRVADRRALRAPRPTNHLYRPRDVPYVFDRILLPTDGSDAGNRAVDQVLGLAAETGAALHLLFVVEDIPYAPEMVDDTVEGQIREVGEATLADIQERAGAAGVEVTEAIRDGAPHEAILEYAAEEDVDLVVMGTHGRSGLDRYLLGSVTERVLRSTHVPVLVVDEHEEGR